MRYLYAALVGLSVLLTSAGQLAMKAGMHNLAAAPALDTLVVLLSAPVLAWTLGGLLCYCLSLLAWLAVLARYPLSLMYPLLSLSYILVYVGATHWALLMEPASARRSLGTVLIAVGVAVVSVSMGPGDRSRAGLPARSARIRRTHLHRKQ
jgi:undecaprenyl phosphate-alpha-L-ara4N flippase subunit ArnF